MQELLFPAGLAIADAERQFSDLTFVMPLNLLLKSYAEEADLSFFGCYAAYWNLERCLANLLRLDMARRIQTLPSVPSAILFSSSQCRAAPVPFCTECCRLIRPTSCRAAGN